MNVLIFFVAVVSIIVMVNVCDISRRKKKKKRFIKGQCFHCNHAFQEGEIVYEMIQAISEHAVTCSGKFAAVALAGNIKEITREVTYSPALLDNVIFMDSYGDIMGNRGKILYPKNHKGEIVQRIYVCSGCLEVQRKNALKVSVGEWMAVPIMFLVGLFPVLLFLYAILTSK